MSTRETPGLERLADWLSVPPVRLAAWMRERLTHVPSQACLPARHGPRAAVHRRYPAHGAAGSVCRRQLSLDSLAHIRDRKEHYERGRLVLLSRLVSP